MPSFLQTILEPITEEEKKFAAAIEIELDHLQQLEQQLQAIEQELALAPEPPPNQLPSSSIDVKEESSTIQQAPPPKTILSFFRDLFFSNKKSDKQCVQFLPAQQRREQLWLEHQYKQQEERMERIRRKNAIQHELQSLTSAIVDSLVDHIITLVRLTEHHPSPKIVDFCRRNPTAQRKWHEKLISSLKFEPKPQTNLDLFDWLRGAVYSIAYSVIVKSDDIPPPTKDHDSQLCLEKAHQCYCFFATSEYIRVKIHNMSVKPKGFVLNTKELLSIPYQATKIYPTPGYFLLAATYMALGRYYIQEIAVLVATVYEMPQKHFTDLRAKVNLLEQAKNTCFRLSLQYCYVAWILASSNTTEIHNAFFGKNMFDEIKMVHRQFKDFSSWQQTIEFIQKTFLPYITHDQLLEIKHKASKIAAPILATTKAGSHIACAGDTGEKSTLATAPTFSNSH